VKMTTTASGGTPFNGGKMNHIFQPGRGHYEEGFASPAAQRCFEDPNSIATLKVHGECCLLVKQRPVMTRTTNDVVEGEPAEQQQQQEQDFEWIFCTRLDTKGKPFPPNHVPVPDDGTGVQQQPAVFGKHTYCFVPLPPHYVVGKGEKTSRPGPDTYGAIRAGIAAGALPDPNDPTAPDFITVEWIGKKHQGNMDCLEVDHAITVHGSTIVDIPVRTRAAVEEMARTVSIEGVVFQDGETGERFKLRFDMLDDNSLFAERSKQKVSTPDSTSIKPNVIVAAMDKTTTTTTTTATTTSSSSTTSATEEADGGEN